MHKAVFHHFTQVSTDHIF